MNELDNWREERRSAYLYRALAEIEQNAARRKLFAELARDAERQSDIWADSARRKGLSHPPAYRPDLRTRLVETLTRRFGPYAMRSVLAAMKVRGMSVYTHTDPTHPKPEAASGLERRHRGLSSGGNLRAAVFGVDDGLVSNTSLILGIAGAGAEPRTILLSGIAGLLAGAFSMAAGEYVSVRSQREMYEYQIGLEREELGAYPEEEAQELALIYEARGLPHDQAKHLAHAMISDPERGLDALAREELGLNPAELGSPRAAAASSFLSFAGGALIPLLPYLFRANAGTIYGSIGLSAAALFAVGAALSLFTGRAALHGGIRMLGIGAAAGTLTYAIGKLLGITLS